MRYKTLSGKEIVNINNGSRLGVLGQTDIELDEKTGQIKSFVIPNYSWLGMKKDGESLKIYWKDIQKIGEDMIMINQIPPNKPSV